MLKKPHYIALGLVALLTLILLNLPAHTASQVKLAIGSLFLPLFGLSKSSQQLAREAGNAVVPRSELIRQNDLLSRSNQVLRIRAMQAEAVFRENEQLSQLLNWRRLPHQAQWNLKLARVVGHDPANWWHTIQIDLGSRDGMQTNLPVIVAEGAAAGFVGRISAVGLTTSQVVLIGSPNCKVSASVATSERTRELGVITGGAGAVDNSLITLSYLASTNNLKPGQIVSTSGESTLTPKGIIIGQVAEDARQLEIGYAEVRVKLAANLNSLEEVWVLMP
jgi:rod shape-determining protein MreC